MRLPSAIYMHVHIRVCTYTNMHTCSCTQSMAEQRGKPEDQDCDIYWTLENAPHFREQ